MNERIKELWEQSRYPSGRGHDEQKFAELIVGECIGVVNKRYIGDNNREDMEVRRCVEDIKRHFGVEE